MISVNDHCRILKVSFLIHFQKQLQIFIVIIGNGVAMFVHRSSQDRMGQGIALCLYFPASGDEVMSSLGSYYRVQHNRKVSAGRIFHTCRNVQAADHQTVFLVFYRTGSDGYIGKQVGEIVPVVRIEHFVSRSQTGFGYGTHMHMADSQNACHNIRLGFRVRLVEHTLIPFTGGPGFIGIDPGYQDKTVSHLILDFCQTVGVFTYRIFIIRRAGAYDHQKFVRFSSDHILDQAVSLCFYFFHFFGHRGLGLDLVRRRKLFNKCKTHRILLCIFNKLSQFNRKIIIQEISVVDTFS